MWLCGPAFGDEGVWIGEVAWGTHESVGWGGDYCVAWDVDCCWLSGGGGGVGVRIESDGEAFGWSQAVHAGGDRGLETEGFIDDGGEECAGGEGWPIDCCWSLGVG